MQVQPYFLFPGGHSQLGTYVSKGQKKLSPGFGQFKNQDPKLPKKRAPLHHCAKKNRKRLKCEISHQRSWQSRSRQFWLENGHFLAPPQNHPQGGRNAHNTPPGGGCNIPQKRRRVTTCVPQQQQFRQRGRPRTQAAAAGSSAVSARSPQVVGGQGKSPRQSSSHDPKWWWIENPWGQSRGITSFPT